uniref:Uncharacterized protein n=1 Tax=Anopheles darlingi TaxID=43151 RepID=A0A2M4D8U9_ANODA
MRDLTRYLVGIFCVFPAFVFSLTSCHFWPPRLRYHRNNQMNGKSSTFLWSFDPSFPVPALRSVSRSLNASLDGNYCFLICSAVFCLCVFVRGLFLRFTPTGPTGLFCLQCAQYPHNMIPTDRSQLAPGGGSFYFREIIRLQ